MTETQTAVLRMLAGEMKTAEIAFALEMSELAIDGQVADIIAKLNATSPENAVTAAIAADLLSTEL